MVKSFCFTGLFLWLYLFHCYCKNFHLGLLMQRGLRNFASYEMQASAISIAVDNARQDGHFRNHTFSVTTRFVDKESQSAGVAVEMITKGKIDLLLGHPSSKRNIGPAYVTPYFNIPHITWEAKDPTMSQKHIFTTLIRLSSVYNKIGLATSALFRQFGWNRAAILADESYALCTHAVNGFLTETTAKKIVIASYQKFNAPSSVEIDTYLHVVKTSARIVFLCGSPDTYRTVMLRAYLSGMCDGYYVFLDPIFYQSNNPYEYKTWFKNNSDDMISREAFRHVIHFRPAWWFDNSSEIRHRKMMEEVPLRMSLPPWNDSTAIDEGLNPTISAAILHDSMYLAVLWWDYADAHGLDHKNGTGLLEFTHTVYFNGTSGKIRFDGNGDKQPMFWLEDMKDTGDNKRIFGIIELFKPKEEMFTLWQDAKWLTADGLPPPSTPLCGFANELCPAKATDQARFLSIIISVSAIVIITVVIIVMWISYMVASRVYWWRREPGYNVPRDTIDLPHVNWLTFSHNVRKRKNEEEILKMTWKVNFKDVFIMKSKRGIGSQLSRSVVSLGPLNEDGFYNPSYTTTARYKGQTVALRKSQRDSVHLTIQNLAELKTMKDILHPNINPFVGACIEPPDIYCLFLYGSKGSLQDVLENDDIKLNWAFQVSVLKDIASGMKFLQSTILKSHGRLKSPNCIIDNRWVVKLTDYGISEFCEERKFEEIDRMEDFKDLLWTAPELLRSNMQGLRNGTKQGDVYSYGIIMHEIFYRCGTFPLGGSTPKEIVEQVKNPTSRIIRPALVLSADIKSPMVNLMQQCWNETSTERPEFAEILQVIKVNNKEACISFVDSMINMLESYANNLEDLVEERTNALNDEKEKTDLLLYRMLPRPVADRLKRGETVNPEQFTQVTIYFSDIVGFTSIAARITPLEVVDFLNEVYTLFDDIIEIFDVYKVETIGDAYMVVSGLPIRNGNIHSAEIAKLALTIIRNLTSFKMKALPNQTVMVRIGIHTGPVCAGVVGQTMPRYCLFGDTVNTASRMESNGEGGKIHITKSTRDALSLIGGFEISERGFISIKLKDLDFADDIALLSSKFQDLQNETTSVKEQSDRVVLKINNKKSKIMRMNTNNREKIKINGEELEEVESFTYLGGIVTTKGGCDEDIRSLLIPRGDRDWASYELQASAISIAVDNARKDGHFLNHTFTVTSRFENDRSQSAGVAVHMITDDNIDLLMGHPSSERNLGISYVTPYYNMPHISWESKDPTLSKKFIFKTLVRLSAAFNKIGLATVGLFNKFNWQRTAILAEEYFNCDYAVNGFLLETTKKKIIVASYQRFNYDTLDDNEIDDYLNTIKSTARIVFLCGQNKVYRKIMLRAYHNDMCNGDYVFIDPNFESNDNLYRYRTWYNNDSDDVISREAFRHVIHFSSAWWFDQKSKQRHLNLMADVPQRMMEAPWNDSTAVNENLAPSAAAATLHDAMYLAVLWWDYTYKHGLDYKNGTGLFKFTKDLKYNGTSGKIYFDGNGDKQPMYWIEDMKSKGDNQRIFAIVETFQKEDEMVHLWEDPMWLTSDGKPPPSVPRCGFSGELCSQSLKGEGDTTIIVAVLVTVIVIIVAVIIIIFYVRKKKYDEDILKMAWKINFKDVRLKISKRGIGSQLSKSYLSVPSMEGVDDSGNPTYTLTAEYKGQTVALRKSQYSAVNFTHQDLLELKTMRDFIHPNINPFIGACADPPHICCIFLYATKGSLQDVLENDDIKLDWAFKVSIIKDIAMGMKYLHSTIIKSHGRLKSSNCIIDNRWTVKITDYGISSFCEHKALREIVRMEDFKDLLWTAPEHLRNLCHVPRNGTKAGDVYSYGIILHETFYRYGVFPMCGKSSKEIIYQVKATNGAYICRPRIIKNDNIKPQMINLMQQCWNEDVRQRPDFSRILDFIKDNNKEAGVSIMDSMINMLERYANNLEDLVEQRTIALNDEKEKTDRLLFRMLPKYVAERLKRGETVAPEAFTTVTIFFSDIVGFTTIAARITPFEVVDFLNEIYTLFDDIIAKFDVYKVETIGDAYMVASGLPVRNGNAHSSEIASMSLTILRKLKKFKLRAIPDQGVTVRIGMHTGPVCAGVVGQTMPRYCLFGDTVNTASRMESNGEGGKIHITKMTKNALMEVGGYKISERGFINIKGKGEMFTYWLDEKIGQAPSSSQKRDMRKASSVANRITMRHWEIEQRDGFSSVIPEYDLY